VTALELARGLEERLVGLRRRLHQVPELALDLPRTQELVLDALAGLDLEVSTGRSLSSVTAVLRGGGGAGPVVLLRGDMDALPVTEQVDVPYASTHTGVMHACGHDLHVAALVGAAHILHAVKDELAGDVVFMFQPGEEVEGGAERMIDEGVLDAAGRRADAAYALHVYSATYPKGTWFSRPGPQYAAADTLYVRVVGEGGHGSAPQHARDPIPAVSEMVLALQALVTRRFDARDPVVVTVGKIWGGTKANIIPDSAGFEATIRTFSPGNRDLAEAATGELVRGIASAHGLTVEVEHQRGYPVTVNDDTEHAFAVEVITDLFGSDRYVPMELPETGSEDFSFILEQVPGAYVCVGACPGDPATAPDNHSPRAAFDDSVVPDAAALLAELAIRRLRPD
jgi:hippurate hydrolase